MSVSVVIPAYRATYLRQAIASVLTQGFEDFELIIGDDNPGDEVAEVVAEFRDRRLRYVRTEGNTGALENCRLLWGAASRPLLKYVFDDDLILPNALIEMVAALQAHPGASFCFSNRYIIDAQGRITGEPKSTPEGKIGVISHEALLCGLIPNVHNPIGEFSNVLIDRQSGAAFTDLETYGGVDISVMCDVVFYLNASARAPAVQIGKTLASFRRHPNQNSSPAFNPRFARGLCEWEVMIRHEYDSGRINPEQALQGASKLLRGYESWAPRLEELKHVIPGLRAFVDELAAGGARGMTAAFCSDLDALTQVVERRWREDRARRSVPVADGA